MMKQTNFLLALNTTIKSTGKIYAPSAKTEDTQEGVKYTYRNTKNNRTSHTIDHTFKEGNETIIIGKKCYDGISNDSGTLLERRFDFPENISIPEQTQVRYEIIEAVAEHLGLNPSAIVNSLQEAENAIKTSLETIEKLQFTAPQPSN